MVYCSTNQKAIVTLKMPDGSKEVIESTNSPINITTESNDNLIAFSNASIGTPCWTHSSWYVPTGEAVWIWNSYYASPQQNSNELASFTCNFQAIAGQKLVLLVAVDDIANIIFNGENIGEARNFSSRTSFNLIAKGGSNSLVFNCINTPLNTTNPQFNPAGLYFEVIATSCVFKVEDTSGVIYDEAFSNCPTYVVSCGDNCPPGYCKCDCKNYPGYCCYDKNGNPL